MVSALMHLTNKPTNTLPQNCIMVPLATNSEQNSLSAIFLFSITRTYSKSGASAKACLWGNG